MPSANSTQKSKSWLGWSKTVVPNLAARDCEVYVRGEPLPLFLPFFGEILDSFMYFQHIFAHHNLLEVYFVLQGYEPKKVQEPQI